MKPMGAALLAIVAGVAGAAQAACPPLRAALPVRPGLAAMMASWPQSPSYLGVDVRDLTPDRVAALKLPQERGVEVVMVDHDAPAGKAGLREHDVILSMNGAPVESVEQLRRMLRETPPGRTATLDVLRDGRSMQVPVRLESRRRVAEAVAGPLVLPTPPALPTAPAMNMVVPMPLDPMDEEALRGPYMAADPARTGALVSDLTQQLGRYFGVKDGRGVLVQEVSAGSPAEAAGVRAGDVITSVNGRRVHDRLDWRRALSDNRGKPVRVTVMRERREQTLTLKLPSRSSEREDMAFPDLGAQMRDMMARMQPAIDAARAAEDRATAEALRRQSEELRRQMETMRRQIERDLQRSLRSVPPEL